MERGHATATFQTGDILACYGEGWVSAVISWLTPRLRFWRKAPSHVAIIAIHSGDGIEPARVYVHESTTLSKRKDAISGDRRRGVQAHLLQEWLVAYRGRVDLLRLKVPLSRERECVEYLLGVHARKVDYSMRRALASASPVVNTENGKYLFCSELVGFALQHGGAIGSHVNCSELTPWDVVNLECLEKPWRLK